MKTDLSPKTIFITGTDTGVGKTVLTALLLSHLGQTGCHALAIKPFCSGGRADAELLYNLQDGDLTLDEINPFHFPEALAPLVAARIHKQRISFKSVVTHIQSVAKRLRKDPSLHHSITPILLIEGAGGLLSPLGENFDLLDLIAAASSIQHSASSIRILLVAPNRLGTINHTLLSVRTLKSSKSPQIKVILTDIDGSFSPRNTQHATRSSSRIPHASRTNPRILAELLAPIPLFRIPYFGRNPGKSDQIHKFAKKCKKTLAQILA